LIPRNAWGAAFSLLSRFGPSKDLFICSKDLFAEAMAGPVASAYQAHQEPKIDWIQAIFFRQRRFYSTTLSIAVFWTNRRSVN
jgi:hypothetical protein